MAIKPPPLGSLSNIPDKATQSAPDYTGPNAPDRVFYMNFLFFRYGTRDKSHGAAVLLSVLLFALLSVVAILGICSGATPWMEKVFTWAGSAFLFVTGVAVGRAGKTEANGDSEKNA